MESEQLKIGQIVYWVGKGSINPLGVIGHYVNQGRVISFDEATVVVVIDLLFNNATSFLDRSKVYTDPNKAGAEALRLNNLELTT